MLGLKLNHINEEGTWWIHHKEHKRRAHFQTISHVIEIPWKFGFTFIQIVIKYSLLNFAYDMK